MNIVVLHGDDSLKSYERLMKFIEGAKDRDWAITRVSSLENLTFPEIVSGNSLFQKERLFVIENLSKIKTSDINWLVARHEGLSGSLVIYNDGFIPKKLLVKLEKKLEVEEFKLPRIIFTFLDSFYPRNVEKCLSLLYELVKTQPIEFIFALLSRQVRDLYWSKIDSSSLVYPSWRIAKLKAQSSKFKDGKLPELISLLAEADIKAKTSKADLLDLLDLIIISKLE